MASEIRNLASLLEEPNPSLIAALNSRGKIVFNNEYLSMELAGIPFGSALNKIITKTAEIELNSLQNIDLALDLYGLIADFYFAKFPDNKSKSLRSAKYLDGLAEGLAKYLGKELADYKAKMLDKLKIKCKDNQVTEIYRLVNFYSKGHIPGLWDSLDAITSLGYDLLRLGKKAAREDGRYIHARKIFDQVIGFTSQFLEFIYLGADREPEKELFKEPVDRAVRLLDDAYSQIIGSYRLQLAEMDEPVIYADYRSQMRNKAKNIVHYLERFERLGVPIDAEMLDYARKVLRISAFSYQPAHRINFAISPKPKRLN